MNELYKKLYKDNKQAIKQFTGEYKMFLENIIKQIRLYSIKSQSTEKVIEEIILEFKENYEKNIRFSSFITSVNKYIEEKKLLCIENKAKQKFNLKEKIGIAIFILIMVGVTIFGFIIKRPVKYDCPTNIVITENIISFDEVEAADKYTIIITDIQGNFVTQISTKYTTYNLANISSLKTGVTYYIYLQTEETKLMKTSDKSDAIIYTKK